jgi:hypothetical protein
MTTLARDDRNRAAAFLAPEADAAPYPELFGELPLGDRETVP